MPATCVPWKDAAGSTASRPPAPDVGPGKTRATITFGDTHLDRPFGKPAGYENDVASKYGFVGSTQSSTTPIFIPCPFAPVSRWRTSAPITPGLRFVSSVERRLGKTRAATS